MDGINLEYTVYSQMKNYGFRCTRACRDLDLRHGTDLVIGIDGVEVHVGITMNSCRSKVISDFEKARKVTGHYAELYFDTVMVDTEEKMERAVAQAAGAIAFLAHHKGFFLVTLDDGKRAKIDSSLQSKMAPVRYAFAY